MTHRPPTPPFDFEAIARVAAYCAHYGLAEDDVPKVLAVLWAVASGEPATGHNGNGNGNGATKGNA